MRTEEIRVEIIQPVGARNCLNRLVFNERDNFCFDGLSSDFKLGCDHSQQVLIHSLFTRVL